MRWTTGCRFFITMTLRLSNWATENPSAARASNSNPSTFSLMRLVPTVTVLA
jgi:hypothetical protein